MTIWKLSPLNVYAADWEGSTYQGDVIVRAESEEEARMCAMQKFVIATKVKPGEKMRRCPWTQPDLVSCVRLPASQYAANGDSQVLEPMGD